MWNQAERFCKERIVSSIPKNGGNSTLVVQFFSSAVRRWMILAIQFWTSQSAHEKSTIHWMCVILIDYNCWNHTMGFYCQLIPSILLWEIVSKISAKKRSYYHSFRKLNVERLFLRVAWSPQMKQEGVDMKSGSCKRKTEAFNPLTPRSNLSFSSLSTTQFLQC